MSEPAGIWLRVSSTGQDEESQAPDCERWVTDHSYDLRRTYTVHGKSAYHGAQDPDWQKVVADVQAGVVKVVIIWKVDRLDRRNILNSVPMVNSVLNAGGRIEFVTQPYIDLTTMPGRMAFANMCEMAFEDSRTKSDRVTAKQEFIRGRGYLVGRPPWGYTSEGDKLHRQLIPTDEGRRLVPEVYRRVIRGDSLLMVAKWLSAETDRSWWPKTLGKMIRNPCYTGRRCEWDVERRVYGKTLHRCEALVDADIWKQAGEALDGRPKRGPVNEATRAMLSGAAFCPKCQNTVEKLADPSPMYRIKTTGGLYYRCSGKGPERRGCGSMIAVDVADAWVNQTIRREWDKPIMERRIIPGNDHRAELEDLQFEIRQLAQLDLPDDEYDSRLTELRVERDRIKALPMTERTVQLVDTGRNYATEWATLTDPERARFLADHHIKIMIAKDELAIAWID